MGETFIKFIKWWISISAFIIGASFLQLYADTNEFGYLGAVIAAFGVVFWLSKVTYEAPRKVFIAGTLVLLAAGLLTRYVAADVLGFYVGDSFYITWWLVGSALGLPVMMYFFAKED